MRLTSALRILLDWTRQISERVTRYKYYLSGIGETSTGLSRRAFMLLGIQRNGSRFISMKPTARQCGVPPSTCLACRYSEYHLKQMAVTFGKTRKVSTAELCPL